jgi:hypothetical protein
MVNYMQMPRNKLTLGSTALTNTIVSAKVTRVENGFDTATFVLPDTSYYPGTVTQGTTVLFEVKDESETAYTTLFAGIVRFAVADISEKRTLTLSCFSIGSGLSEMLVACDYGDQTTNGLDSITEILTDATNGIIPNYVQKMFGGTDSNYDYDTTNVASITDNITYVNFPYKPADKAINDICDLVTAARAGSSGPHWIVTYTSPTNYLRVKYVDGTQTGWTKYYGNSQANATLTYGVDYTLINLEKLTPEANYIVYFGAWRRPSNGDYWTELNAASWDSDDATVANDTDAGDFKVNTASIKITSNSVTDPYNAWYPSTIDLDLDFTYFKEFNQPSLNYWIKRDDGVEGAVWLTDSTGDYFLSDFYESSGGTGPVQDHSRWYHLSIPVGDYSSTNEDYWTKSGTPEWNDIQYISFIGSAANTKSIYIDGLHFGDANVCRVAALSDYTGVVTRQRLIVDDVGKDDSLVASDDSGLMAQLAYSELLRLQKTSTVGTVETPMIIDMLPGQWVYIQSTDYRVTKVIHTIGADGYKSALSITDDTTNSRPRTRYEDLNKLYAAIRPEWQDRQAANIKAGQVDWRVTRLVKTY